MYARHESFEESGAPSNILGYYRQRLPLGALNGRPFAREFKDSKEIEDEEREERRKEDAHLRGRCGYT